MARFLVRTDMNSGEVSEIYGKVLAKPGQISFQTWQNVSEWSNIPDKASPETYQNLERCLATILANVKTKTPQNHSHGCFSENITRNVVLNITRFGKRPSQKFD